MLSKIFLVALIVAAASNSVFGQRTDGDCVAPAGSIDDCSQFIYSNCKNATFVADRLAYGDQCSPISLFWDAPVYNMTVVFQSNFSKPYDLCIRPVGCTQAYRTVEDGSEVVVDWNTFNNEPVCFKSTRSDAPTMRFRFDAGDRWHCYGSFIRFFYRT